MMINKILLIGILTCFCSVAISAELPDSSQLPRIPDAYRSSDSKGLSARNPIGMSVYDTAEKEVEEDMFGSEVVSLEESKRILSERKKAAGKKKLNQGE